MARNGKIKVIQINKRRCGYHEVNLYKNNNVKRFKVHRLVAQAFIPNPQGKPQVNHIDGDKSNNRASNLEWATDKENKAHAWRNGLATTNHKKKSIICNETGEVFESVQQCSEKMGLDRRSIFRQLKGERKTVGGHTFQYRREWSWMKNNETIKNSAMLGGDGVKGFNTLRVFEAFA